MSRDDNEKKIIHFPDQESRSRLQKEKALKEKEVQKEKNLRQRQEKQWRVQYKSAQKARLQSQQARLSASGKVPFFNFDKIPPFTRFVVLILVLIHIGITILLNDSDILRLYHNFGFTPAAFTANPVWSPYLLVSPVTSIFIHGGWMHIAFNSIMMAVMGVLFERMMGTKKTILYFLAFGIAGNLVYLALSPFSTVPVIGASGAISGLFAFSFLTIQTAGIPGMHTRLATRSAGQFIVIWLLIIVGFGLLSPNTAWQSHLGGFLSGIAVFYAQNKHLLRRR